MSLQTDTFFVQVLTASTDVQAIVDGRIYDTIDDEIEPDTAAVPYVMIYNDGTDNQTQSKDDECESDYDNDNIRLQVVAQSRSQLATLATLIRSTIRSAAHSASTTALGFDLVDYAFHAGAVLFDEDGPCYYQDLIYNCETLNIQ